MFDTPVIDVCSSFFQATLTSSIATSDILTLNLMSDVLAKKSDVDWAVVCVFHISYSFKSKKSYIHNFFIFPSISHLMCGYRSTKLKSREVPFATLV